MFKHISPHYPPPLPGLSQCVLLVGWNTSYLNLGEQAKKNYLFFPYLDELIVVQ